MVGRRTNKQRRAIRLAERRAQVLQMVIAGKTTEAIAGEFMVSRQTIANDIKKALASTEEGMLTAAAEVRRLQHLRLEQAFDAIWLQVKRGDLDAIGIMIRLLDREAKLLGLDAPQRIDIRKRVIERAVARGWEEKRAVAEIERLLREHSKT